MMKFEVHILGCGSAVPTTRHFLSSQVVNIREKLFMIDCGEGTQFQLRKSRLKFSRVNRIFISHLHGDHFFGLLGLVSSFGLLGRTSDLHIYSPFGLEKNLKPLLDAYCANLSYQLFFHEFEVDYPSLLYEDRSVKITMIPLNHRIPCCGFLFNEKPRPAHIIREEIDYHQIPVYEINKIKNGGDYIKEDGTIIPHEKLTRPSIPPRSYAYCSDTAFHPPIVEQIKGIDLLYHEATFGEDHRKRANETYHSTASDAATIAKMAEVKRLLIGHFSARYTDESILLNEAKTLFHNTTLANEQLCISL
ncbi:MAG: ribonuclease Z [Bacteroidales bacterium]|nr:ribonuclease Z [Bacteroidales bacterium]